MNNRTIYYDSTKLKSTLKRSIMQALKISAYLFLLLIILTPLSQSSADETKGFIYTAILVYFFYKYYYANDTNYMTYKPCIDFKEGEITVYTPKGQVSFRQSDINKINTIIKANKTQIAYDYHGFRNRVFINTKYLSDTDKAYLVELIGYNIK